jgi:phosphonate transport system substrate-binding protein
MSRNAGFVGLLAAVMLTSTRAESALASPPTSSSRIRVGAVAYSPSVVTVFDDIRRFCRGRDLEVDYVLYSNYDSLVQALVEGDVDIAWNTPLAHAKADLKLGGRSRTLVMRDVDCGFRSVLVVQKESSVKQPDQLKGKTLILGSREAAEATVLPLHYLGKAKVPIDQVTVLDLDREFDFAGNPCSSPTHVLKALRDGRGSGGIIGERLWNSLPDDQKAGLEVIWTSPPFSHCVFTGRPDLDADLARRFTDAMLSMTPENPLAAEVLRLEGARCWVKGRREGFDDLSDAIKRR